MSDQPVIETLPKICPDLSTAQIVPLQLQMEGQARVVKNPQLTLEAIKTGKASPGAESTVVGLVGGFGYKNAESDPNKPPQFIGDPVTVRCIGPACMAWDDEVKDCRKYTSGGTAAALAAARDLLNKASQHVGE